MDLLSNRLRGLRTVDICTTKYQESSLISILSGEYVCDKTGFLIILSGQDRYGTFRDIDLRPYKPKTSQKICLADVKDKIQELLLDGTILNKRDYNGLSALHLICSLHSPGQMKILKLLCTQSNSFVNITDSLSRTPLHHALSPQNLQYHSRCDNKGESLVDILTLLIDNGADVNCIECNGFTPLHLALDACGAGNINELGELPTIIRLLVEAGANTNINAPGSHSVLHLAVRLDGDPSLDVLRILITPENINSRDALKRTPLHELLYSAERRTTMEILCEKVQLLINNGANINAKDDVGITPLFISLELFNDTFCIPLVKYLLENGAMVTTKEHNTMRTPLHLACSHFDRDLKSLVPLFLNLNADLNMRDHKLSTPFHYALKSPYCSPETLDYLISAGADVKATDADNNGPIHLLCESQHHYFKAAVSFFINKGCDINKKNKHGFTPLLVLLQNNNNNNHQEAVEVLVELGADCNAQNNEGIGPLHMVSRSLIYRPNIDEVADIILKGGAMVNLKDCLDNTPLHYAVRDNSTSNLKAIRKLLLSGADSNIRNALGKNPLHIACSNGSSRVVKLLLNFGADVNASDADYNTPLHLAHARNENSERTLEILIDYGADITAKNNRNATPFMLMETNSYYYLVSYVVLLMAAGKYSLNDMERKLLDNSPVFNKRYHDCFSCVMAMNSHYLGKSNITILEFLISKSKQAARYVRNTCIADDLQLLVDNPKYRWYSVFIENKLSEAKALNRLLTHTSNTLNVGIFQSRLPECIVEHILKFLDEEDMNVVNKFVLPGRSTKCRPVPL